jgi:carotenoid cleavage dioxygenase-like enzyme
MSVASRRPDVPDTDTDRSFMPGFRSLDRELDDYRLPVEGSIPAWLGGRLVRNGPGKFEAGDDRVSHWFDGLAMLRSYSFADGEIRYTNRFLRSEAYDDAMAGQASGQFATDKSGLQKLLSWVRRLGPPTPTDNANVHVAHLDDEFVAMTEVPRWISFDPATLESRGEFAFADDLSLHTTTAHLVYDQHRGEHVGYGVRFGRTPEYRLYRVPDGTRRREQIAAIETDQPAYIHACAVTPDHVVLPEVPLRIRTLRALSPFTEGFFDLLDWQPDRGLRLIVVDRDSGEMVADPTVDPLFTFHTANAFVDDGEVVVDLVDFEDDTIVSALTLDTLETEGFPAVPPGRLARYRIDPASGDVSRTRLYDGGIEMPGVPRGRRTQPHRYVYGQVTDREGANGLVKVDTERRTATEWWEQSVYVEEPRVVTHPDADTSDEDEEDRGVVLAPGLDVDAEQALLFVFDAETLTEIARARLPHHHPFGFHGRYFPDT